MPQQQRQYISTDPNAGQPIEAQVAPDAPAAGLLPTAGGLVGSLVGTVGGWPGRIAGAGVGGALGKGAELFMDEKDDSLVDSIRQMGTAGLQQAGGEVAGGVIGKGVQKAGKLVYKGGVALLPKTLKREYPSIAQVGFQEGIPLTGKGAQKAEGLLTTGAKAVDDKLALMQRSGLAAPIQPREIVQGLRPVRDTLKKRADLGLPDETPALAQRAAAFGAKNKGGIPLTKAQSLKREAQAMADTAFKAQRAGNVIKDDEMLANRAMAQSLRGAIESRVPSVGPMNERLQGLKGVMEGAEHAAGTGHILSRLGGGGLAAGLGFSGGGAIPALGAGAAGLAMTTPQGLTTTGLGLKAAAPVVDRASARLLALLAQLATE